MFKYVAHAVHSAEDKSSYAVLWLSVLASLNFGGCIAKYIALPVHLELPMHLVENSPYKQRHCLFKLRILPGV